MLPWSGRILSPSARRGAPPSPIASLMVVPSIVFGLGDVLGDPQGGGRRPAGHVGDADGGIVTAVLTLLHLLFRPGASRAAVTDHLPHRHGADRHARRDARPPPDRAAAASAVLGDVKPIAAIAVPAVLTNIATPSVTASP
jgi:hypothetical protein